jgi:two-component system phosphate regulon response regulator OmpR
MEFDLLKAFAEHSNHVLSRGRLLDLAHNRDWEPFGRSIDIRIVRIRRKVEAGPGKPQVIKPVRATSFHPRKSDFARYPASLAGRPRPRS